MCPNKNIIENANEVKTFIDHTNKFTFRVNLFYLFKINKRFSCLKIQKAFSQLII
jgi:hypothetical protein